MADVREEIFPVRQTYTATDGVENVVMRLNGGMIELRAKLVQDAEAELRRKAPFVGAGIDEFTATERFALQILAHTF